VTTRQPQLNKCHQPPPTQLYTGSRFEPVNPNPLTSLNTESQTTKDPVNRLSASTNDTGQQSLNTPNPFLGATAPKTVKTAPQTEPNQHNQPPQTRIKPHTKEPTHNDHLGIPGAVFSGAGVFGSWIRLFGDAKGVFSVEESVSWF